MRYPCRLPLSELGYLGLLLYLCTYSILFRLDYFEMLMSLSEGFSNAIDLFGGLWSVCLLLVFLLATSFCAYFLLVSLRNIAIERNLFDKANERSVHRGRVPRLGGLMFIPVLIFSVAFLALLSSSSLSSHIVWLRDWHLPSSWFALQAGLLIVMSVGFRDDMIGMRYSYKFLGQLLAAFILMLLGKSYGLLSLFGVVYASELGACGDYVQAVMDLFFVLTLINGFNLIDGIDGLSSGLSIIAFSCYTLFFIGLGERTSAILCLVMIAILFAFLRMNLLKQSVKRTKMFMGDTGSMTLGFMLATVVLMLPMSSAGCSSDSHVGLMSALAPLMIPLMDLVWVFATRILSGHNPFLADKTHVHHRVMATGLSQRQTLLVLLALSLAFVGLNACLSDLAPYVVLIIDLTLWGIFNGILYIRKRKI